MKEISVIIPTMLEPGHDPPIANALRDILGPDGEIILIRKVSPAGRARNQAAAQARGKYLLFMDDDGIIGEPFSIERLLAPLADPAIAISGASQAPPAGEKNAVQRSCYENYSRSESTVVNDITDSDMATTLCYAMRASTFKQLGGFDERLSAGQDTEYRERARCAGFRVVLAPRCMVYHPLPKTLRELCRREERYGIGQAQISRFYPPDFLPKVRRWGRFGALVRIIYRWLFLFPNMFFPLHKAILGHKPEFHWQPFIAIAELCFTRGYFREMWKHE